MFGYSNLTLVQPGLASCSSSALVPEQVGDNLESPHKSYAHSLPELNSLQVPTGREKEKALA